MSEDERPIFPTDDMAIAALIKHWRGQRHPQVHMVYGTDSAIFAEAGFAGAVITSRPTPDATGMFPPPATHTFILPVPPLVIVSAWQTLASQIADGSRKLDE